MKEPFVQQHAAQDDLAPSIAASPWRERSETPDQAPALPVLNPSTRLTATSKNSPRPRKEAHRTRPKPSAAKKPRCPSATQYRSSFRAEGLSRWSHTILKDQDRRLKPSTHLGAFQIIKEMPRTRPETEPMRISGTASILEPIHSLLLCRVQETTPRKW